VIITGALHALNPSLPALAQADVYSAADDPKFAGHDLALSTTAPITDAVMIGWSLSVIAP
jgi:hypothetical protein